MPPKTKKRGSTQVVNSPKRKRIITRRMIESDSQRNGHDSAPEADANLACAPSDQSRDFDGDRPLPQIQAPAKDGRLAGGQSRISQSHLCNTGMNSETGRFTNIDFNNGFFDTVNHDTSQLGLGTNTQSLCIGGLSMGDQGQSRRPAPVFSIFDNVGSTIQ